jgi:putative hydrolase of the HAD superfamily
MQHLSMNIKRSVGIGGHRYSRARLIQVIESSFAANGTNVSRPFCHALYDHFSDANAYQLFSDVIPSLDRLSQAHVTMGVISDFDERLDGILAGLGVRRYFNFVVQSFIEGYSKPSKELYEVALRRAGESEGVHIGDDLEKDAFTNATSILLDRNQPPDGMKISSLTQLPSILST